MALYAIKDPKGKLLETTVTLNGQHDAWTELFCSYDKRLARALDNLYRDNPEVEYSDIHLQGKLLGYRCVRVYLTEEKP